ncbi:MAG: Fis family transcriptional regulator [Gammaproteobacteria bacterium]|nr:Fis family transcriptional regulator [Gammaproteobacteria bacterium]
MTRPRRKAHASAAPQSSGPLACHVRDSLDLYFEALNGHEPADLYEFVVAEVERPLFEVVLARTGGNLTHAAQMLGINRGTLRKKLRKHGLA